jgi:methyl-accepting chemotaxis protein
VSFSLALDILLAGLLAVTIAYAAVLNRRLKVLRDNKDELQKLAVMFGDSTVRAEQSIARLKATADELGGRIDKAQSLRDDLAFLIERGGSAADRLEAGVRAARKQTPKEAPAQPAHELKAEPKKDKVQTDTDAERELLNALRSAR